MEPATTDKLRPLTDDEIARLEKALGSPIEQTYLAYWMSQAMKAFIMLMTVPSARERRDDLNQIAKAGRGWIEAVEQSRSARLLPPLVDVKELMRAARTFCELAGSLARQLDQVVGPGHPRSNVALEAFLERLIGIAKRAKVLPSTPSRAYPIDSASGPPFFAFVNEALEIAMEVIRYSPLPQDQMDVVLAALSRVTDQALTKTLERLRGRVERYCESAAGLVEWEPAEAVEPAHPHDCESD
jgi:hypothetical protein